MRWTCRHDPSTWSEGEVVHVCRSRRLGAASHVAAYEVRIERTSTPWPHHLTVPGEIATYLPHDLEVLREELPFN